MGGIGFAIVNAFAEEFLFRGVMYSALEKLKMTPWKIVLVQAISFGCLHINGFPRGSLGVALASIYGVMMGIIRKQCNGLLAPWFFHVFADVTIVTILLVCVN
jgi:membrane protease YdiL (CAAX protease family)